MKYFGSILIIFVLVGCTQEVEKRRRIVFDDEKPREIEPLDIQLEMLKKRIVKNPDNDILRIRLAHSYARLGKMKEAIVEFRKAVKLKPKNDVYRLYLARAYFSQKEYDNVINEATEAIIINPNFAKAYVILGEAYYRKNNKENAVACYKRCYNILRLNNVEGKEIEIVQDRMNNIEKELKKSESKK